MSLNNTTALITGASRGLGRALALILARRGVRVVMVARNKAALDAAVAEVTAAGGVAFGIAADLGDDASRRSGEGGASSRWAA